MDEDGYLIDTMKSGAVLGTQTIRAIRDDMERMGLPTGYTKAPKHPGEKGGGSFKADEWKAFCTINLPFTLTRLWGSLPLDDRRCQMLENFLHLVTAVKIANLRSITDEDINKYEEHMRKYLTGFLKLYPFAALVPYQHLAMHFPDHLRRFGPTHSWRCFPFERYNGIIQNLPSNSIFGKRIAKF